MITIIEAIISINPNAKVSVSEENYDTIQWHNGTSVISLADIETKITEVEQEETDAKADKETKKASGKTKLKNLGLDDDEIKALTGA